MELSLGEEVDRPQEERAAAGPGGRNLRLSEVALRGVGLAGEPVDGPEEPRGLTLAQAVGGQPGDGCDRVAEPV